MSSLGEDLKKQREQRKMSLDEIAQQTKVGLRHLRALETDRFDQLPEEFSTEASCAAT